jgi:transcriptional repressor NrdR
MRCPYCRQGETKVIDSRASQHFMIRRRRECLNPACHRRFTTYERVEQPPLMVVKKDQSRDPFDREKLRAGIERACWKRPVSPEQIEGLVSAVEAECQENFDGEVASRFIGDYVIDALREIDEVAQLRFASVYRGFEDISDFVEEAEPSQREAARAERGVRSGSTPQNPR